MPTFDITSTFDKQEVTNAVDQMNRELVNRYDFRGTNTTALLSENNITIKSSTEERMNAADQVLKEKFTKRNVSIKFLSNFEDNFITCNNESPLLLLYLCFVMEGEIVFLLLSIV